MSSSGGMFRLLRGQWFLFALIVVLAVSMTQHESLESVADQVPRDLLIASIMLATSAPMALSRRLTGKHPRRAALVGIFVNVCVAPPLAWIASYALPTPLAVGLVVTAIVPCTLASAAVWTRRGGGNEAVALLVTVVTNFGCFVTIPFWAWLLLRNGQEVEVSELVWRLLRVVVLPLLAGQALRRIGPVRRWCDERRLGISLAAQMGILVMLFVGSVRSGALLADPTIGIGWGDGVQLIVVASLLHLLLFGLAWRLGLLMAPRGEALASAVSGSQKTLTVGIDVALAFGGMAVLPLVVYHAAQLLIDSALVDWIGPRGKGSDEEKTS